MWMDRQRFEAAVERHQRRVFTLATYLLSDVEEAEDVAQEVLIRLWRKGGAVSPEKLEAWLLRVTRNASYDRLRQRQSASRLFVADPEGHRVGSAATEQPDPEVLAGASEFGRQVSVALAHLKEPAKSTVILREIQGLSYQQIADVLELPLSTVRVALHRGRRKLRQQLGEVYHHVSAG
jgi:RNA polymerase sigma-70 factor (ECF subfamily)